MSYDLGVWFPHERLNDTEAGKLYRGLCQGAAQPPRAHPAVEAFYQELTARHPEINTVPNERIDDHDYCPWSATLDRSPGHVIMPCVWSKAEYVDGLVREMARKHGLAVFDPQTGRISYPDSTSPGPTIRPTSRMQYALPFLLLFLVGCSVFTVLYGCGPIECPHCHNSNANVKGACIKRQRDGFCREDHYDKHYNLSSCPWCSNRGSMRRIDAFLD